MNDWYDLMDAYKVRALIESISNAYTIVKASPKDLDAIAAQMGPPTGRVCECGAHKTVNSNCHADWCQSSPNHRAKPKAIECNCKVPDYGHVGYGHAEWCLTKAP